MEAGRKMQGTMDPDAEIGLGAARVAEGPCCAWPSCTARGAYPAPQSPQQLRAFIWFCLEHIREYNKNWNYFAGMDEQEIEAHRRADTTWHRPSWRFGTGGIDDPGRFHDPFGFFHDAAGDSSAHDEAKPGRAGEGLGKTARMLAVLDLEMGFTLDELKRRYKTLVKRHHPDLHNGCRIAEERLKAINEAYTYLVQNQLHR
jgi:DnaJ-domain-containing protein 1